MLQPIVRPLVALALVIGLAAVAPAGADSAPPERPAPGLHEKVVDALLVRPIGLSLTAVISAAVFVFAYPASLVLGDSDWVIDICIDEPIEQYIKRPLGEF